MKSYRCSVCKRELTIEEVENYKTSSHGLEFNWGMCDGEEAHLEEFDKEEEEADIFFGLMHKAPREGLYREIEKMYNEIKDLRIENKKLKGAESVQIASEEDLE